NANPSPEEPFKFKDEVAFLSQAHNKIKKLTRVTNSKVADEIKTISGLEFADFLFVETKYPITGDSGESIDVIGFSLQNETEKYYAEYYRQLKDKISEKGAITGKIIRLENIDNEKIDFEWQEASKSYRTLNIDTKNADFTIQVEEQAKEEPPIIED
ncbi:31978_t:CDS:2, partial [Racocetra persica]